MGKRIGMWIDGVVAELETLLNDVLGTWWGHVYRDAYGSEPARRVNGTDPARTPTAAASRASFGLTTPAGAPIRAVERGSRVA